MNLYNTASRSITPIEPLDPPKITFYACGFTSYDYAHIGHVRKYTNDDILRRALTFLGYEVDHVMNLTDVGHLVSDSDEGEDKMSKGARKYQKSVDELSDFFTQDFLATLDAVNIQRPGKFVKATDHISDMIALIQKLEEKGHTYTTTEAVYFDTSTFDRYGALSGQNLADKKVQVREEVHLDTEKKNPTDFALWFKRVGKHADHAQHWDSPWGDGFPGWHIECSAMSMKYLGETIDIHSGGVDHIPVHHENEIAQSECATSKPFVKHWFHTYFLMVDGVKMSKSLENFLRVADLIEKGYDPLAMRYLLLQTHYRQTMNFTWEALDGAATALDKLRKAVVQLRAQTQRTTLSEEKLETVEKYAAQFKAALENDLQMPQALATVWEVIKSNIPSEDKLDLILSFDQVLGLKLGDYTTPDEEEIPAEILQLAEKRQAARQSKDFAESDRLRDEIAAHGYVIEDTGDTFSVKKA